MYFQHLAVSIKKSPLTRLSFLLLLLAACTKEEPRYCYSCLNIAFFSPAGGATGTTISDTLREEVCGQTESNIRDYERRNSSNINLDLGGTLINQDTKTTCTQK